MDILIRISVGASVKHVVHSVSVTCFHRNTSSHLLTSLIYHLRPFSWIPAAAGRPQTRQHCLPSRHYFLGKLPASTCKVDSVSVCMKLATLPSFDFLAVPCGQVECLCRVLFMSSRTQALLYLLSIYPIRLLTLHRMVYVCMHACLLCLFVCQSAYLPAASEATVKRHWEEKHNRIAFSYSPCRPLIQRHTFTWSAICKHCLSLWVVSMFIHWSASE